MSPLRTWIGNLFANTDPEAAPLNSGIRESLLGYTVNDDDSDDSSLYTYVPVVPLPPNMVPPAPGMLPLPPPLLLTKRVTAFLRANLSDLLRAAVLTTPAGNLLVHASNLPASVLRRQCAVAASLWEMRSPTATNPANTNNGGEGSSSGSSPAGGGSATGANNGTSAQPPTATVQLDSGTVFVIRQLQCGMLFICMGGEENQVPASAQGGNTTAGPSTAMHDETGEDAGAASASGSAAVPGTGNTTAAGGASPLASPSEVDSVHSAATTTNQGTAGTAAGGLSETSVLCLRIQAEELARWLDARLGSLYVPEIGIGAGLGA